MERATQVATTTTVLVTVNRFIMPPLLTGRQVAGQQTMTLASIQGYAKRSKFGCHARLLRFGCHARLLQYAARAVGVTCETMNGHSGQPSADGPAVPAIPTATVATGANATSRGL